MSFPEEFGQPSHRPKLSLSDHQAAGLRKALQPGDIGVFQPDIYEQVPPLGVIASANVEPAE